jgi:hypothetical protein
MDQAGRSAFGSDADEDRETDLLCLRATELESVCICGHGR